MMTTDLRRLDLTSKLDLTAKLFRGFADPSRLAILETLRCGERCVSDVVHATGLTHSNVSSHLACLKDCGLVTARQEGRYIYYRLADPEVEVVLESAEAILGRFASQIAACVNYTVPDGPTPAKDVAR